MITGGSSMAAMIFKAPPQLGQCSMSMSETCLSSRAQLMRAGALCPCGRDENSERKGIFHPVELSEKSVFVMNPWPCNHSIYPY